MCSRRRAGSAQPASPRTRPPRSCSAPSARPRLSLRCGSPCAAAAPRLSSAALSLLRASQIGRDHERPRRRRRRAPVADHHRRPERDPGGERCPRRSGSRDAHRDPSAHHRGAFDQRGADADPPAAAGQSGTVTAGSRRDRIADAYRVHVRNVGQEPRLFAAVAFLVTFLATRVVTHLLLDERGGGGIAVGSVHIHHMALGLVLILVVGLLDLAVTVTRVRAVLFGIGAALVLDEFALILNLAHEYWAPQSRESIDAVVIFAAALIVVALGGNFWKSARPEHIPGVRVVERQMSE